MIERHTENKKYRQKDRARHTYSKRVRKIQRKQETRKKRNKKSQIERKKECHTDQHTDGQSDQERQKVK